MIGERLPYPWVVRVLAGLFAIEWGLLAYAPNDRTTWLLENALVLALVGALALAYSHFRFSRLSYLCIFVFLCIHEVGAHYTYSEVPYDAWSRRWLGVSIDATFGWDRNQFDRIVHFLYGLLLAYPIRELFLRWVAVRGIWGYASPLGFTLATSLVYEIIEWGAAVVFGGDVGIAYVGAQGDVWDSQKDSLLAGIGATLAMALTLAFNSVMQRDFAREWADSLRVKSRQPLGEEAIARMVDSSGGADERTGDRPRDSER